MICSTIFIFLSFSTGFPLFILSSFSISRRFQSSVIFWRHFQFIVVSCMLSFSYFLKSVVFNFEIVFFYILSFSITLLFSYVFLVFDTLSVLEILPFPYFIVVFHAWSFSHLLLLFLSCLSGLLSFYRDMSFSKLFSIYIRFLHLIVFYFIVVLHFAIKI